MRIKSLLYLALTICLATPSLGQSEYPPPDPAKTVIPKGCVIEGGLQPSNTPQKEKEPKIEVRYGNCGNVYTAWLVQIPFDEKPRSVILLDTLSVPLRKKQPETFDHVSCYISKKMVHELAFSLGKWANGDATEIKAGRGLQRVWKADIEQRKFVEVPIPANMRCVLGA
jgi:hypothetical protein